MRPTRNGQANSIMQLAPAGRQQACLGGVPALDGANRLDHVQRGYETCWPRRPTVIRY